VEIKTFAGATTLPADAGDVIAVFAHLDAGPDADGDIIDAGAFAPQEGARVPLVHAHDWARPVGIGTIRSERGAPGKAVFHGKFNLQVSWARDSYESVKELSAAGLQEWSFGFAVNEARPETYAGRRVRRILKATVFEVSPVLVGAGRTQDGLRTHTVAVKEAVSVPALELDPITEAKRQFDAICAEMDARAAAKAAARRAEILAIKGDFDDLERVTEAGVDGLVLRTVDDFDVPPDQRAAAAQVLKACARDLRLPAAVHVRWWRPEEAVDREIKRHARRERGAEPWLALAADRVLLGWVHASAPDRINLRIRPDGDLAKLRRTAAHEAKHARQALDGLLAGIACHDIRSELERDAESYASRYA
jgi:phage head maturation protease